MRSTQDCTALGNASEACKHCNFSVKEEVQVLHLSVSGSDCGAAICRLMADPPNGDPGGDPTSSLGDASSSAQQGLPPPLELRRITRGYKRRRNDTTIFTGSNKTFSFEFSGRGEGRGTNLDKVAWLIANLKETVTQQNDIIKSLRTELKEIKS